MRICVQVWVKAEQDSQGLLYFSGDSDSDISKGLCAVLCACLSGKRAQDVMDIEPEIVQALELDTNVRKKILLCEMEYQK